MPVYRGSYADYLGSMTVTEKSFRILTTIFKPFTETLFHEFSSSFGQFEFFESGNLLNSSFIFVKYFLLTVVRFDRFVVLLLSHKTTAPYKRNSIRLYIFGFQHSRPQSPSFLGHVVGKREWAFNLTRLQDTCARRMPA